MSDYIDYLFDIFVKTGDPNIYVEMCELSDKEYITEDVRDESLMDNAPIMDR